MSVNYRQFCCDPFKSHRRHVYSYHRVLPAAVVTDRVFSNCLRDIRKRNPQVTSVDIPGPSSLSQADAGPAAFSRLMQAPATNSSPRSSVSH